MKVLMAFSRSTEGSGDTILINKIVCRRIGIKPFHQFMISRAATAQTRLKSRNLPCEALADKHLNSCKVLPWLTILHLGC